MKHFIVGLLVAFAFLWPMPQGQAAFIPQSATMTVGGRVFTDLANLKILYGGTIGANNTGFRSGDGTGYQVPLGKSFRIQAMIVSTLAIATSGANTMVLGYDVAPVGFNSGSALTTPTYFMGTSTNGITLFTNSTTQNEAREEYGYVDFTVPALMYPFVSPNGGSDFNYIIFGYEI